MYLLSVSLIPTTQLVKSVSFRGCKTSIRILAPPLSPCVSLNTLLNFSESVFSSVKREQYYLTVGPTAKNPPANAGNGREVRWIPGWGRSTGGGHGTPLQYSCLENPTDRGAWWAVVHGVAKTWTRLTQLNTQPMVAVED